MTNGTDNDLGVNKNILSFCSSGLFFMIFGSVMLLISYEIMSTAHSSFTFVLVVVGVAILLYGTGTQGTGEYAGGQGDGKYKAVIAGGAGLLAFLIGIGMVLKHDKIKEAFQIQQKYVRVPIVLGLKDGFTSTLDNYAAIARADGVNVPTVLHGDGIEIYVPYFAGQDENDVIEVTGSLYRLKVDLRQKESVEFSKKIKIPMNQNQKGGFEFPRVDEKDFISIMVSVSKPVDSSIFDEMGINDKQDKLPKPIKIDIK